MFMFNEYQWKLYLNAGGQEIVDFFEHNLSNNGKNYSKEYAFKVRNLRENYCPCPQICEYEEDQLLELAEETDKDPIVSLDDLWKIITLLSNDNGNKTDASVVFEIFSSFMVYFSTVLCMANPEKYIPYHYQYNFNVLGNISEQFSISLPLIPAKKNYKERFYYYEKVCHALCDFRNKNCLTPYELLAFLYDFAPNYVGGFNSYIVKDLPKPGSAYFIGTSPKDRFLYHGPNTIVPWQCNPDTKAGDMIVMYQTAPISAVKSIWRSVSVGFNDPFFWYYRCTYIGQPKIITTVSLKQMQNDPILEEMPIVRKNMQGINGVELIPSQYNYLLKLGESDAIRLDDVFTHDSSGIRSERDVEKQLIEILLNKLGYTKDDYVSQLQIRVGNNNFVLIPDYVLLPVIANGHHTAHGIIEAKYSISTKKMLNDAKAQMRSYAKQLGTKFGVVASKEGLWLTTRDDDYEKVIFETTFNILSNDKDVFSELKKILSRPT